jgi:YVTN family beta-propeller protein
MSDSNTANKIEGPIGVTDREEYFKLKDAYLKNTNAVFEEDSEKIDEAKWLRHPLAYVCDYIGATVSVIDIARAVKLKEIKVGNGALSIDIGRDNKFAYVTNFFDNTLSVISTANNQVTATVTVGSNPAGVKVSRDGRFVYVVHFGEPFIYVIDSCKLELVTTTPLPSAGFQLDITKDGGLAFVSLHNMIGRAAVVDLDVNLVVKVIQTGSGAEDVKISPVSPLVFISNEFENDITPVNINLAEPASTAIGTGSFPVGLAFGAGGKKLYVTNRNDNNVSVKDVFSRGELTKIEVGAEPYGATATTEGKTVIVSNYSGNSLSIIDTETDTVLSTVPAGTGPAFSAILEWD